RFEAHAFAGADALVSICDHVADAAAGFAAEGKDAAAAPNQVIADDDVFGRAIDAQAVGVAPCLQTDVVVVIVNVAIFDQHVAGRINVYAVGAGAAIVADLDLVDRDVIGIDDLHCPEARAPQAEVFDRHVRRLPDNHQPHALAVVIHRPAQSARFVTFAAHRPVLVPPLLPA